MDRYDFDDTALLRGFLGVEAGRGFAWRCNIVDGGATSMTGWQRVC